jgi:sec-independent protein translocase protein TatA
MFDIGGGELLLILLVVMLMFGPKKLPELMQGLGKGMREFKKAQREFTDQINNAFEDEQRNSYRRNENDRVRREPNTIARSAHQPTEYEAEMNARDRDVMDDAAAAAPSAQDAPQGAQPRNSAPYDSGNGNSASGHAESNLTDNNDTNNQNV